MEVDVNHFHPESPYIPIYFPLFLFFHFWDRPNHSFLLHKKRIEMEPYTRPVRIRPRRFNGSNETFRLRSWNETPLDHWPLLWTFSYQRCEGFGTCTTRVRVCFWREWWSENSIRAADYAWSHFKRRQDSLARTDTHRERERTWAIGSSFNKPVHLVNAVCSGNPVNE